MVLYLIGIIRNLSSLKMCPKKEKETITGKMLWTSSNPPLFPLSPSSPPKKTPNNSHTLTLLHSQKPVFFLISSKVNYWYLILSLFGPPSTTPTPSNKHSQKLFTTLISRQEIENSDL